MKKLLLLLLASLVIWGCFSSSTSDSGGSGSEIVGDVAYEDGDSTGRAVGPPVVNGKIFIFKTDYKANTSIDYDDYIPETTTDYNGNFGFGPKYPGTYLIEANDNYGKAVTRRVTVTGDGDTVDAHTMIVKRTSSLNYTINTSLSISGLDFSYVVYILGTRIYAKGDENNLVDATLENIPYGTYDIAVVLNLEGYKYEETFSNIKFDPGVVLDLTFDVY